MSPIVADRQLVLDPCVTCSEDRSICAHLGFHGLTAPGDALAEYLVVKAMNIFPLPDLILLKVGTLIEPPAVAWHAVRVSGINEVRMPLSSVLDQSDLQFSLCSRLGAYKPLSSARP